MVKKEILMIDQETKDRVSLLKANIKHYEGDLKRPPLKFIFGSEDTHDIANRRLASYKKELKEIEDAWGIK